ncbi:BQ5605_C030g10821 [Microbotryum silenes-dioicae]|uniref:BQ5605_C030g10821 protein n=1 Tax=Microbotryum silenes-dioicae TaxID=796604 RepID=A0A2X0N446_9BASI|nr:BQ5605_C030g10821 [Microbotryum silenes-dioicae]
MSGISPALQRLEEALPNRVDWRYEMRREAQQILPGELRKTTLNWGAITDAVGGGFVAGLFIGPFQPSWNLETLNRLGITHILCIAESREQHLFRAKFPERFVYLILEVRDADDQNLIKIFPQTQAFIDGAIEMGGAVLVHCGDGISRSPAIATAYVMVKHGLTHEDAFQFVQSRRFCVAPRLGFQHQIEAYAPIFMASQTMTMAQNQGEIHSAPREKRREREDDDEDDEEMGLGGGGSTMNPDLDMHRRVPTAPQWGMA